MGGISIWQIGLVAILALLLFGRGRISALMGDVAKGIKSFKKGLAVEEQAQSLGEAPAPTADTMTAQQTRQAEH